MNKYIKSFFIVLLSKLKEILIIFFNFFKLGLRNIKEAYFFVKQSKKFSCIIKFLLPLLSVIGKTIKSVRVLSLLSYLLKTSKKIISKKISKILDIKPFLKWLGLFIRKIHFKTQRKNRKNILFRIGYFSIHFVVFLPFWVVRLFSFFILIFKNFIIKFCFYSKLLIKKLLKIRLRYYIKLILSFDRYALKNKFYLIKRFYYILIPISNYIYIKINILVKIIYSIVRLSSVFKIIIIFFNSLHKTIKRLKLIESLLYLLINFKAMLIKRIESIEQFVYRKDKNRILRLLFINKRFKKIRLAFNLVSHFLLSLPVFIRFLLPYLRNKILKLKLKTYSTFKLILFFLRSETRFNKLLKTIGFFIKNNSFTLLLFLNKPFKTLLRRLNLFKNKIIFSIGIIKRLLNYSYYRGKKLYYFLARFKSIFVFVKILYFLRPFLSFLNSFLRLLRYFVILCFNWLLDIFSGFKSFLVFVYDKVTYYIIRLVSFIDSFNIRSYISLFRFFNKKFVFTKKFFNIKLAFIRIIGFANWLKHGYFLSVFLVVSLLGFSFNALTFYKDNNRIKKDFISICYEKDFENKFDLSFLGSVKRINECSNSDVVITDRFGDRSIPLYIDAAVIVGPEDIHNLHYKDFLDSIKKGYFRDYKIYITTKAKKSFFKNEIIPSNDEIKKDAIFIISLEELNPYMNVIMIDGYYPAKSMIVNGKYSLSHVIFARFNNSDLYSYTANGYKDFSSIVIGGDIMLDRGVGEKIEKYGYEYIIEDLKEIFKTGDISFANLECPISNRGKMFNLEKGIFFRAKPEYIKVLKDLKINIVSLANNHILDYGLTAALDTIGYLKSNGINYTGMGLDRQESLLSPVLDISGKKVRIIAYNDIYPYSYNAEENVPGLLILKDSNIAEDISLAKRGVDYLFVSVHTGEEFILLPENNKVELFRKIIDLGADGVIGGHPHTFQPFEFYKGKPIIYSTGNLIFDQYRLGKNLQEQVVFEFNFYNGKLIYIYPHFFRVRPDFKPEYLSGFYDDFSYLISRIKMDYSKLVARKN